ncbi:MAG: hypothetical protein R3E66_03525, partial [bacterium]
VKEHGVVGVRFAARKRFAAVKAGDRFVAYVTQQKFIDGAGHITSDVFESDEDVFNMDQNTARKEIYRHRVTVEFDDVGWARDAGDVLWHLSPFEDLTTTTPTNLIFCRGGFVQISDSDVERLHD